MQLEDIWKEANDFRFLKYNLKLAYCIGNEDETLFLTYILYWQSNKEKWVYKSKATIDKELHFKPYKQKTCINRLIQKGLLETKVEATSYAKVKHFRVKSEALTKLLETSGKWVNLQANIRKNYWKEKRVGLETNLT